MLNPHWPEGLGTPGFSRPQLQQLNAEETLQAGCAEEQSGPSTWTLYHLAADAMQRGGRKEREQNGTDARLTYGSKNELLLLALVFLWGPQFRSHNIRYTPCNVYTALLPSCRIFLVILSAPVSTVLAIWPSRTLSLGSKANGPMGHGSWHDSGDGASLRVE
ncbi:hypothetical protein V2G26_017077 [Clonostachys chloroleuca]